MAKTQRYTHRGGWFPGDVVTLMAGIAVPADALVLDSKKSLLVDEGNLRAKPILWEKTVGPLPVEDTRFGGPGPTACSWEPT